MILIKQYHACIWLSVPMIYGGFVKLKKSHVSRNITTIFVIQKSVAMPANERFITPENYCGTAKIIEYPQVDLNHLQILPLRKAGQN